MVPGPEIIASSQALLRTPPSLGRVKSVVLWFLPLVRGAEFVKVAAEKAFKWIPKEDGFRPGRIIQDHSSFRQQPLIFPESP